MCVGGRALGRGWAGWPGQGILDVWALLQVTHACVLVCLCACVFLCVKSTREITRKNVYVMHQRYGFRVCVCVCVCVVQVGGKEVKLGIPSADNYWWVWVCEAAGGRARTL